MFALQTAVFLVLAVDLLFAQPQGVPVLDALRDIPAVLMVIVSARQNIFAANWVLPLFPISRTTTAVSVGHNPLSHQLACNPSTTAVLKVVFATWSLP